MGRCWDDNWREKQTGKFQCRCSIKHATKTRLADEPGPRSDMSCLLRALYQRVHLEAYIWHISVVRRIVVDSKCPEYVCVGGLIRARTHTHTRHQQVLPATGANGPNTNQQCESQSLLNSYWLFSCSRNSSHFMQPGNSLTCLKQPATWAFPEPA